MIAFPLIIRFSTLGPNPNSRELAKPPALAASSPVTERCGGGRCTAEQGGGAVLVHRNVRATPASTPAYPSCSMQQEGVSLAGQETEGLESSARERGSRGGPDVRGLLWGNATSLFAKLESAADAAVPIDKRLNGKWRLVYSSTFAGQAGGTQGFTGEPTQTSAACLAAKRVPAHHSVHAAMPCPLRLTTGFATFLFSTQPSTQHSSHSLCVIRQALPRVAGRCGWARCTSACLRVAR